MAPGGDDAAGIREYPEYLRYAEGLEIKLSNAAPGYEFTISKSHYFEDHLEIGGLRYSISEMSCSRDNIETDLLFYIGSRCERETVSRAILDTLHWFWANDIHRLRTRASDGAIVELVVQAAPPRAKHYDTSKPELDDDAASDATELSEATDAFEFHDAASEATEVHCAASETASEAASEAALDAASETALDAASEASAPVHAREPPSPRRAAIHEELLERSVSRSRKAAVHGELIGRSASRSHRAAVHGELLDRAASRLRKAAIHAELLDRSAPRLQREALHDELLGRSASRSQIEALRGELTERPPSPSRHGRERAAELLREMPRGLAEMLLPLKPDHAHRGPTNHLVRPDVVSRTGDGELGLYEYSDGAFEAAARMILATEKSAREDPEGTARSAAIAAAPYLRRTSATGLAAAILDAEVRHSGGRSLDTSGGSGNDDSAVQGAELPPPEHRYVVCDTMAASRTFRNSAFARMECRQARLVRDIRAWGAAQPERACVGYVDMSGTPADAPRPLAARRRVLVDPVDTEFMHHIVRMLNDPTVAVVVLHHRIAEDFVDRYPSYVNVSHQLQHLRNLLATRATAKPLVFVSEVYSLLDQMHLVGAFAARTPEHAEALVSRILDTRAALADEPDRNKPEIRLLEAEDGGGEGGEAKAGLSHK